MNDPHISLFSVARVLMDAIILLMAFYSAWINLSEKRISKFGLDALILSIGKIFDKERVGKIHRDPELIRKLGGMMILVGLGAVYSLVMLLIEGF